MFRVILCFSAFVAKENSHKNTNSLKPTKIKKSNQQRGETNQLSIIYKLLKHSIWTTKCETLVICFNMILSKSRNRIFFN